MLNAEVIYGLLGALLLCVVTGPVYIPVLRKLKFGQNVRNDGPQSHLLKSGTPTIGGLIILTAFIFIGGYFGQRHREIYPILFFAVGCGIIGFIDDYIKVVLKRSLGLTAMQKMLGLVLVTVIFTLYVYNFTNIGSKLIIPFFKGYEIDLGPFYIPFIVFVILGTINGVNLTDGLDGLASGITAVVAIFFTIASLILGNVPVAIFSSILAGSCIGFLFFNIHPARIFMGDTGSLALGGAVSAIAVVLKMPIFIAIVGGIYLAEALSVIIQVAYFKATRKRIFRMAPLHHHYELSGWRETKVVSVFWLVTGILNVIGLIALS